MESVVQGQAESLMALMNTDDTDPFLPSTPVREVVGGPVQSVGLSVGSVVQGQAESLRALMSRAIARISPSPPMN